MRNGLIFLCFLLSQSTAIAGDFYYGVALGLSHADWTEAYEETSEYSTYITNESYGVSNSSTRIEHQLEKDNNNLQLRVFSGYAFNGRYALELGWVDFGSSKTEDTISESGTALWLNTINTEATGFYLVPTTTLSINKHSNLTIKVGLLIWKMNVEHNSTSLTAPIVFSIPNPNMSVPTLDLPATETTPNNSPDLYADRNGVSPFIGIQYHYRSILVGWHHYVLADGNIGVNVDTLEFGYQF
ncbi:MAG: hypothetical protein H0W44_09835 [Gammaproteobacteria bacterium]|nr:hypothetical protein [Gammaproteobacteria bacterium]